MARRKRYPEVLYNVTFTSMADKGRCVGRDPEGKVVFAEGAAPGDIADVQIFKKRKGVLWGRPNHFHKKSDDRVEPFCAHFGVCGGCKWQHVDYAAQLQHKEQGVYDTIQRIGKVDVGEKQPILGGEKTTYYRNKLDFGCANRRWLTDEEVKDESISQMSEVVGFHRPGAYDKLIQIDHCHLQGDPSNAIRTGVRELAIEMDFPFFDMRERTGSLRQLVIRTSSLGQTMVLIAFYVDDQDAIKSFLTAVQAKLPEITSLFYCVNSKVNEYLMDLEMHLFQGTPYIEEALGHIRCRIGPKSFFQTNTGQATRLFDIVAEFAGLTGEENVYDLYTGIGSIGLYLAKKCRQIVGIEEIAAAIDDAKINAELNGIENARFYAGDVKDILTDEFAQEHGAPDVLITDPPRAGMHPKVVQMLIQLAAPKLVYVSCNPATQARDLQLLDEVYRVEKMRPVDMFPHTSHIENVALLVKRS
ncbi:23S rRNA (uracil(1939)-C(5))-methyltransferase RlmD [Lewinella cohaerens]|uniref:23S rRNA (uracil(1939)-C(5))-methyltransferase RlmD n=1 Tax=Lewinella cohaerens TaxID=70995 RepID=UPI00035E9C8C|nr:23S rRNA (uracil(1939)-C(5))-methyltransferase RlmD [Lewinella cohaerens]